MADIPFSLTDTDFLQEALDFSAIKPVDFENLVFHLIDEMGFSNVQWRKGGEGNSATDGGRDLEATYWNLQPAGSTADGYWFEVKFRSNGLEKQHVQSTVLNACSGQPISHLVIVTNSTISNPTADWIKEHQRVHKLPKITVWQGHDLERLLRKNPRTLSRFLPGALAFSGRCKVIESKFSNLLILPSGDELSELWSGRGTFEENSFLLLICAIAEVTYGDIVKRPWGMSMTPSQLVAASATATCNIYPFIFRCSSLNRSQEVLIEGIAYLFQCLLIRCGEELTAKVLCNPEALFEQNYKLPFELQRTRYDPVLKTIYQNLAIHCSSKSCEKLHYLDLKKNEQEYFDRFRELRDCSDKDEPFLIMNSIKRKCQIELVALDEYCPLGDTEVATNSMGELEEKLAFVRAVLITRLKDVGRDA